MKHLVVPLVALGLVAGCSAARAGNGDPQRMTPAPCAVAGIGSSSMYGKGATVAPFLTVFVDALGSPCWARNEGSPGIESSECLDRWRASVRGRGFDTLVVMCGVNDVRAGTAASTAWTHLEAILEEARADGLRVVAMTLQPFKGDPSWTPEKHAQLVALNASIRGWCRARHAGCVDAYAALSDPRDDGALRPQYDDGDHLHFNQAAHDLLGRLARAALR